MRKSRLFIVHAARQKRSSSWPFLRNRTFVSRLRKHLLAVPFDWAASFLGVEGVEDLASYAAAGMLPFPVRLESRFREAATLSQTIEARPKTQDATIAFDWASVKSSVPAIQP